MWIWNRQLVAAQRAEIEKLRREVNALRPLEEAYARAMRTEEGNNPALSKQVEQGLRRLPEEAPELKAVLALIAVHRGQARLIAEEPDTQAHPQAVAHANGGGYYLGRLSYELQALHAASRARLKDES